MNDAKTTTELQAPPDWAINLTQKVVSGFAEVDKRLDAIETNVDLQGNTMRDLQQRATAHDARITAVETRQSTNSERVRETSKVDLVHDAAIAEIRTTVQALADRPDTTEQIIAAVKDGARTPTGQKIVGVLGVVLVSALTLLGLVLQAQVAKLQAPAPPTVVYVTADGGAK